MSELFASSESFMMMAVCAYKLSSSESPRTMAVCAYKPTLNTAATFLFYLLVYRPFYFIPPTPLRR
jgi:hypothetical protein